MKASHKKKVTLMIDADVYHGLRQKAGSRGMGAVLSRIMRPHVVASDLEAGYRELASDKDSSQSSRQWESVETLIVDENVWRI